jgi:hypothetical protein
MARKLVTKKLNALSGPSGAPPVPEPPVTAPAVPPVVLPPDDPPAPAPAKSGHAQSLLTVQPCKTATNRKPKKQNRRSKLTMLGHSPLARKVFENVVSCPSPKRSRSRSIFSEAGAER